MSLITRCPACATMFKVVPDQLRVSDGWVRCGQCDEVFDANAHLQSFTEAEPEAVEQRDSSQLDWGGTLEEEVASPTSEMQLDFPAEPAREATSSVLPSIVEGAVDSPVASGDLSSPSEGVEPVIADTFFDKAARELVDESSERPEAVVSRPVVDAKSDDDADVHQQVEAAGSRDRKGDATAEVRGAAIPGFLRKSVRPSRRRSRTAHVVVVFCVLLVCALGTQILVQERDRIAATESATLTLLEPLCALVGCQVNPLRQIESVVIDHSAFTKVQPNVYRFSFSVKSTALVAVAVPSLELTLTDLQDRPVIRRVFSPQELGARVQVVVPGGEWSGSLPVEVKAPDGAAGIAGYRLLAFYP